MQEQILNQLLTIKYATINNFYSPTAKTSEGSLQQTSKYFARMEKQGLIRQIPLDEQSKDKRTVIFWQITHKGAKSIDRIDEYGGTKEAFAYESTKHRSMKIDIAMSFLRLYPNHLIDFDYRYRIDKKTPDILVKMDKYVFIVEIERKRSPGRVIEETCKKWNDVDFKKHGLPAHTKVLIVYAPIDFDVFMRPQEYRYGYGDLYHNNLKGVLKRAKNLKSHKFRFIHFINFNLLSDYCWYTSKKETVQLIPKSS